MIGVIYFLASPDDRPWVLSLPAGFVPSIITISLLGCVVAWSVCLCVKSLLDHCVDALLTLSDTLLWRNDTSSHCRLLSDDYGIYDFFVAACAAFPASVRRSGIPHVLLRHGRLHLVDQRSRIHSYASMVSCPSRCTSYFAVDWLDGTYVLCHFPSH